MLKLHRSSFIPKSQILSLKVKATIKLNILEDPITSSLFQKRCTGVNLAPPVHHQNPVDYPSLKYLEQFHFSDQVKPSLSIHVPFIHELGDQCRVEQIIEQQNQEFLQLLFHAVLSFHSVS